VEYNMARRLSKSVFISYSSTEKVTAEAICNALEGAGIHCYVAHRDNKGGTLWDEAIVAALDAASAVVLVLSHNANQSPYVKREIERAASLDLPIAPFRIENVMPGPSLAFFISVHHWLDGFPGAMEQHLGGLVESVQGLLKERSRGGRAVSTVNVKLEHPV
jgi:hypothetical protein